MKRRIGAIITALAALGALAGMSSTAAAAQARSVAPSVKLAHIGCTRNAIYHNASASITPGLVGDILSGGGQIVNGIGVNSCLGIQGSSDASGAKAEIGPCANPATPTQTWSVNATTTVGGLFGWQFVNGVGFCLGVTGSATYSGAQVVQGICGPTTDHSQIWRPETINSNGQLQGFPSDPGNGIYWLNNAHSNLCMGVKTNGVLVIQGFCDTFSVTQQWHL